MRSIEDTALLSDSGELGTLSILLTPVHVTATITGLVLALFALVGLTQLGIEISLVRGAVGFVLLSFVPGFLVLELVGITPDARSKYLVYAVGMSLVLMMALGALTNFALRAVGVANPISELPIVLSIGSCLLLLTGVYYICAPRDISIRVDLDEATSPLVLGLALLPFLGIYGALALNRFDSNLLLLLLYAIIAILPILVLYDVVPERLLPIAILSISLSLLLQNALSGHFLAWGDQTNEAGLVLRILRNGYWAPIGELTFANKYSMLRIVVLHPVYALVTGLDAVWLFKIVHPLLFSLAPVALFAAYRQYTDDEVAFLSVFLYVSLFSFFTVLSRNTRTATAILFLAIVALVITDESIERYQGQLLGILSVLGIVVSHYGVSYILMLALLLALPVTRVFGYLSEDDSSRMRTSVAFVLLYFAALFGWYIYASPESNAFYLLFNFGTDFVENLKMQFFVSPESSSASVRIVSQNWRSTTLNFLKYYNVAVGAITGVGLVVALGRFFRSQGEENEFGHEFLSYALVFMAIFGITFLPVERFNTARTYPVSLLFFAPFFVLGIREGFTAIRRVTPQVVEPRTVRSVAAGLIVLYFLLNVGFISATVTHEYSPNVLVEKERVSDGGHPIETEYFYKQYPTVYDIESNYWLRSEAKENESVYASHWPGNLRGTYGYRGYHSPSDRHVPLRVNFIPKGGSVGPGYVYLGAYSCPCMGNTVTFPAHHFDIDLGRTTDLESKWARKDRIYTNGGSVIRY